MKKTMQELAEALGISRTTVSLVLKGKGDEYRISRETQNRIHRLVEEENFKPNYFAQALNRKSTRTIGIIFPDLFEEFMVQMIRGMEDVLAPRNYNMILMTSRFRLSQEKKNLQELIYRGADGILLVPTCHFTGQKEDRHHLEEGQPSRIVMIDRIPDFWQGPGVLQDDRFGGAYAARFLRDVGCGSFTAVSLDLTASTIKERLRGFRDTIPEAGQILLKEQNPGASDLEDALKLQVSYSSPRPESPLGIFVTTSGLALRVKEILEVNGLRLNREFRIIRFGSDPKGYSSGMASIPQPHYEMGKRGAQLLLEILEEGQGAQQERIILDLPLRKTMEDKT